MAIWRVSNPEKQTNRKIRQGIMNLRSIMWTWGPALTGVKAIPDRFLPCSVAILIAYVNSLLLLCCHLILIVSTMSRSVCGLSGPIWSIGCSLMRAWMKICVVCMHTETNCEMNFSVGHEILYPDLHPPTVSIWVQTNWIGWSLYSN